MARETQKTDSPKKIVEVAADLVEDEHSALGEQSAEQAISTNRAEPVLANSFAAGKEHMPPSSAFMKTFKNAMPFVLISLALFALPLFLSEFGIQWMVYSQVRTYMLCALIWNLIGACLYAQVESRSQKILLFIVFALPLITSPHWASFMYVLEMALRLIFKAPL